MLQSVVVQVLIVAGYLRPVYLFPMCIITGLRLMLNNVEPPTTPATENLQ